jgi:hypothetical protein
MSARPLHHVSQSIRRNILSWIAIFIALGGSGYAAIAIPRNSVGTSQLRKGAVTPAKLGAGIGGSVRAWAMVGPSGKLIAGSGHPTVTPFGGVPDGIYGITWGVPIPKSCATVANVEQHGATGPTETVPISNLPGSAPQSVIAGYVSQIDTVGGADTSRPTTPSTELSVFNQADQLTPLPFDVAIIC